MERKKDCIDYVTCNAYTEYNDCDGCNHYISEEGIENMMIADKALDMESGYSEDLKRINGEITEGKREFKKEGGN